MTNIHQQSLLGNTGSGKFAGMLLIIRPDLRLSRCQLGHHVVVIQVADIVIVGIAHEIIQLGSLAKFILDHGIQAFKTGGSSGSFQLRGQTVDIVPVGFTDLEVRVLSQVHHGLVHLPLTQCGIKEILMPGPAFISHAGLYIQRLGQIDAVQAGIHAVVIHKVAHLGPVVDLQHSICQLRVAYLCNHGVPCRQDLFVGRHVGALESDIISAGVGGQGVHGNHSVTQADITHGVRTQGRLCATGGAADHQSDQHRQHHHTNTDGSSQLAGCYFISFLDFFLFGFFLLGFFLFGILLLGFFHLFFCGFLDRLLRYGFLRVIFSAGRAKGHALFQLRFAILTFHGMFLFPRTIGIEYPVSLSRFPNNCK